MVSTPKTTGLPVSRSDAHDPGRGLPGDVLEVGGLAADDAAKAEHSVVIGRQRLGGQRDLERAGHPSHVDVVVGDAGRGQAAPRALEQAQRDVAVEAGGDDGDAQAGAVEIGRRHLVAADVLGHQPAPLAGARSSPTRSAISRPKPSNPP